MIGKILLFLLGLILLALLILLLLPFSLYLRYESGELSVWMKYAAKRFVLHPSAGKSEEDTKKKKAKKGEPENEAPTEDKARRKPNLEQILYSLDVLPGVLMRAFRGTMHRIRIEPLKLHILVALDDPADTAVLYGKLEGAFNAVLPSVHQKIRIREQDIQLFPDFFAGKMDLIADFAIHIRPCDILVVAFAAAGGLIKWYSGYKKRADKDMSASDNTSKKVSAETAV